MLTCGDVLFEVLGKQTLYRIKHKLYNVDKMGYGIFLEEIDLNNY